MNIGARHRDPCFIVAFCPSTAAAALRMFLTNRLFTRQRGRTTPFSYVPKRRQAVIYFSRRALSQRSRLRVYTDQAITIFFRSSTLCSSVTHRPSAIDTQRTHTFSRRQKRSAAAAAVRSTSRSISALRSCHTPHRGGGGRVRLWSRNCMTRVRDGQKRFLIGGR